MANKILDEDNKVVLPVCQEALGAEEELISIAEKLGVPIFKALLDKTIIHDNKTNTTRGICLLEATPFSNATIISNILLIAGAYFRMWSISLKVRSSQRNLAV